MVADNGQAFGLADGDLPQADPGRARGLGNVDDLQRAPRHVGEVTVERHRVSPAIWVEADLHRKSRNRDIDDVQRRARHEEGVGAGNSDPQRVEGRDKGALLERDRRRAHVDDAQAGMVVGDVGVVAEHGELAGEVGCVADTDLNRARRC